jgi:hypothetical protein
MGLDECFHHRGAMRGYGLLWSNALSLCKHEASVQHEVSRSGTSRTTDDDDALDDDRIMCRQPWCLYNREYDDDDDDDDDDTDSLTEPTSLADVEDALASASPSSHTHEVVDSEDLPPLFPMDLPNAEGNADGPVIELSFPTSYKAISANEKQVETEQEEEVVEEEEVEEAQEEEVQEVHQPPLNDEDTRGNGNRNRLVISGDASFILAGVEYRIGGKHLMTDNDDDADDDDDDDAMIRSSYDDDAHVRWHDDDSFSNEFLNHDQKDHTGFLAPLNNEPMAYVPGIAITHHPHHKNEDLPGARDTCKSTTCAYFGGIIHVYSKTLNNYSGSKILAKPERWHCQREGETGCKCDCEPASKDFEQDTLSKDQPDLHYLRTAFCASLFILSLFTVASVMDHNGENSNERPYKYQNIHFYDGSKGSPLVSASAPLLIPSTPSYDCILSEDANDCEISVVVV